MKILFDNGTPRSVSRCLAGHEIIRARQNGWHELENGELIQAVTQGESLNEAMEMARDSLNMAIAYRIEQTESVPAPS